MRKLALAILIVTFLVSVITFTLNGFASTGPLEDAVLKGEWGKVINILEKDGRKANDPVSRMIMGHACLATNRNNESMVLFLSVKEQTDLKLWSKWSESLLQKNTENPFALYLNADAQAREGKLKNALQGLDHALKIKGDLALGLNARGTVHVLTNEWDNAMIDLIRANEADPNFADAFASLGTYWVIRDAADGALEAFNKAITLNPEFALAYNGRGVAYFGMGKFDKAAEDFSTASHLSPVVAVAEVNQGFASAYASRLITLANMKQKPGTTIESVMKQYPSALQEQKQQLQNSMPTQKDQAFQKKMDALPWILQDTEKTKALIQEYGPERVQMGAAIKAQELRGTIAETNQKVQGLHDTISSYDRKIGNIQTAAFITSLVFSASGTTKGIKEVPQKGWEYFQAKTELGLEKSALSAVVPDRTLKTIIDAIPTGPTPIGLGSSIASSSFKTGQYVLEDKRAAARVEFERLAPQVPVLCAQLRSIESNLSKLNVSSNTQQLTTPSSQIPGYYTSTDRPLTEIGSLASMADNQFKTSQPNSPRRAIIVDGDHFRSSMLNQEINSKGFVTKVVPPTVDIQAEANRFGASIILGVRGGGDTQIKPLAITDSSPQDISKIPHDADIGKKLPPPFPPDKFGGARVPKQNWDWGKSFTPANKSAPGGVSTEEIAKAFVDRGDWPVLTTFSLLYTFEANSDRKNAK